MFLRVVSALSLGLACLAFSPVAGASSRAVDFGPREPERLPFFTKERPFRLGHWAVSPAVEREKTMASASATGIAYHKGIAVLAYDQDWVGAFDFATRKPLWWFKGSGGLTAPASIFDDAVVLGFRDGSIYRLNLQTGKQEWSTRLASFPSREMIKQDNQLLVVTASQALHSLDFTSGHTKWLVDGGGAEFLTIRTTAAPTYHQGTVYYGLASGDVLGIDLASGKEVVRFNPDPAPARFRDVIGPLYVMDNDKMLVSRSDGVVGCFYITGSKKGSSCWAKPLRSDSITATYYGDGLFLTGSFNGFVTAYNPQDGGKKLWQQSIYGSVVDLVLVNNTVFSATSNGKISAFKSSDGTYRWSDHLEGIISSPARVIDDGIFYLTGQNVVYGFKTNH